MTEKWLIRIGIVILLFLIVGYPALGWNMRESVTPNVESEEYKELLRKYQVESASRIGVLKEEVQGSIPAFVYSRYPFNFKHEFLLNAGADKGVSVGDTVLFAGVSEGVFVGTITDVFAATAIATTIFDSNFERAVRIGTQGIDALLTGGLEPKLTLIPKKAAVAKGDLAYTASPGFPYGIPVGTIRETKISSGELFHEALLDLGYEISDVKEVTIVPVAK